VASRGPTDIYERRRRDGQSINWQAAGKGPAYVQEQMRIPLIVNAVST
jgi:hypothetical protein